MKETIDYLKQLGLTDYQSRAMIVLFCKGETTAKSICTLGGIRPTKIYSVLKSLEDKGFVQYTCTKPREYQGLTAKKAVGLLLGKKEHALEELKKCQQERMRELNKIELVPDEEEKRTHYMWNVEKYKML